MRKYICDICGKDSNDVDYILPTWIHVCGGRGNTIIKPKISIDIEHYNLCEECKKKIADYIYDMTKQINEK